MAIKQRDSWANPYTHNDRLNGVHRGRQDWSDLQGVEPESLQVARGIGEALVLGAALWAVVALVVLFLIGVL